MARRLVSGTRARNRAMVTHESHHQASGPHDTKLLATIEHGQDLYRFELRTVDSDNIDRQWFLNGVPVHGAPRPCQREAQRHSRRDR